MSVLEAKLSSIPGLDAVALPSQTSLTVTEPDVEPELTPETNRSDLQHAAEVNDIDVNVSMTEDDAISSKHVVLAKDHPAYAKFFRMIHLGVPLMAVINKCRAENPRLETAILNTPDRLIPTDGGVAEGEENEEDGWSQ